MLKLKYLRNISYSFFDKTSQTFSFSYFEICENEFVKLSVNVKIHSQNKSKSLKLQMFPKV